MSIILCIVYFLFISCCVHGEYSFLEEEDDAWTKFLTTGTDHIFLYNSKSADPMVAEFTKIWEESSTVRIIQDFYANIPDGWVHLSPVPIDRTCLLPPPVAPMREVTPYVNTGEHINVNDLLNFANARVGTYKTETGADSALGSAVRKAESMLYELPDKHEIECASVDAQTLLHNPDLFMEKYWLKQQPVVIKGYLSESVPVGDILAKHADKMVGVKLSDSGDFEGVEPVDPYWKEQAAAQTIPDLVIQKLESPHLVVVRAAHEQLSLGEVVPLLLHSSNDSTSTFTAYVEYQSLSAYPELMQDLLHNRILGGAESSTMYMPSWLHAAKETEAHIWFGDGRTVGKLHFDRPDNILVQIAGSKEFELVSPINSAILKEGHMREANLGMRRRFGDSRSSREVYRDTLEESTSMVHSPLSISDLKAQGGRSVKCLAEQGDALFVPSFWWHEVTSSPSQTNYTINLQDGQRILELPLNMAVNYWFSPLYDKGFPCRTCLKSFNNLYASDRFVQQALLKAADME
jgi:peptidyl-lysine (3S)-dioxygenase / protease